MKVEVGRVVVEGFSVALSLRFENGLVLQTRRNLFATGRERAEVAAKLQEILEKLEQAGFEVQGREKL